MYARYNPKVIFFVTRKINKVIKQCRVDLKLPLSRNIDPSGTKYDKPLNSIVHGRLLGK